MEHRRQALILQSVAPSPRRVLRLAAAFGMGGATRALERFVSAMLANLTAGGSPELGCDHCTLLDGESGP